MKKKLKQFSAVFVAAMMLVGAMPGSVYATQTGACANVLPDAPETAVVSAGNQYSIKLSNIFNDVSGHTMNYSFSCDVVNNFTKLQNGTFYFSTENAGDYDVTLKAVCPEGEVTHTMTITVEEAPRGEDAQYNYDETPQDEVTVYVTVSNNGMPLMGADGTILSHYPVTVPYFDLGLYELDDYKRYETEGGSGSYTGDVVVERPTGLHLYIYLLEKYYMGLDDEQCCKGTSDLFIYDEETEVLYMDGATAYESGGLSALTISGSATSLYMTNFWGHDENLMYYRNHCYPYMSPGWGATSDYILLSDNDTWDVAMFSNWDFYNYGYFAAFDQDTYNAAPGGEVVAATVGWDTTFESTSFVEKNGLSVGIYDSNWEFIDSVIYDDDEGGTLTFNAPEEEGTYYLMALDPAATDEEEACIAPATAMLLVGAAETEVWGITLDKSELELNVGDEEMLVATIEPEESAGVMITWETTDEEVVTVEDGRLTAIAPGTTTITATAGDFFAECVVTVLDEAETVMIGDVNDDGVINSTDAALIYSMVRRSIETTEKQQLAADVNNDGVINSTDAALVYRYANGKLSEFPGWE